MNPDIKTPKTHPDDPVVGRYFAGQSLHTEAISIFYCDSFYHATVGHPKGNGYWMTNIDDPTERRNVSAMAVGSTFMPAERRDEYWWVPAWPAKIWDADISPQQVPVSECCRAAVECKEHIHGAYVEGTWYRCSGCERACSVEWIPPLPSDSAPVAEPVVPEAKEPVISPYRSRCHITRTPTHWVISSEDHGLMVRHTVTVASHSALDAEEIVIDQLCRELDVARATKRLDDEAFLELRKCVATLRHAVDRQLAGEPLDLVKLMNETSEVAMRYRCYHHDL